MEKLVENISGLRIDNGYSTPKPKVLEEVSVTGIADHIRKIAAQSDTKKILVMTGAGISTAAGIPDFRTPGTGLYDNIQKFNFPNKEAIFDIIHFRVDPKPFYYLAKEMYPGKFKPTLSHYFIRLLEIKNLLLRNYTQNIDTLERCAGITDKSMHEAHGGYYAAHCITCATEYSPDFFRDKVFADELPLCTKPGCAKIPPDEEKGSTEYKGLIKPDINFFGESLPEIFERLAVKDTKECELLIVMGTSLAVQPFASLANRVRDDCPRLLINLQKVGEPDPLKPSETEIGFDFSDKAYRDVFLQGTCDNGVRELAKLLGWEDELMKLYEEEHARLDAEMKSRLCSTTAGSSVATGSTGVGTGCGEAAEKSHRPSST